MGWIFFKPTYERMKLIEQDDLERDPVVRLQHKYYVPVALTLGFVFPPLLGLLWEDPVAKFMETDTDVFLVWHCTFLVNSLAHKDGLQPYSDEDTSRGNFLLAILTGGEGNHNFHHTFPHDFRSGPSAFDWDPSKWIILALSELGLVHGLRRAKKEDVTEAAHYMHKKYSGETQLKESSADETEEEWQERARTMSKREANGAFGVAEGSRPKRPRRDADDGATSDGGDGAMSDNEQSGGEGSGGRNVVKLAMGPQEVKRHGLHIWQTVKDAVNKEGRNMATIFMRKPNKRMFPDYYMIIQNPIGLEDIKAKIEKGGYPTLEDVRQDFELCFNNSKLYNMKDSIIWKDAKELLKTANKAYAKIIPPENGEEKKSKPPSLNRMLKTRLQKLVDKSDEHGRYLATEFMELPSRKLWPFYYKEIKRPQCFSAIFKKLKQKEYQGAPDFAADVELVFSNAMTFNQEHTQIWEDALTLRSFFRQLMSDLPPPHSLPQYSQPSAKIKIKLQTAKQEPTHPSLTLKVPAAASSAPKAPPVAAPPAIAPKAPQASLPVAASAPIHLNAPAVPAARRSPRPPVTVLPPQPAIAPSPLVNSVAPQYPSSSTIPANVRAVPSPAPRAPALVPTLSQVLQPSSLQNSTPAIAPATSPAPPSSQFQLKSVKVQVQPQGRVIYLDHTDGVKSWALRMLPGETRLVVSDVTFLNAHHEGEEEESSDEEEEEDDDYDEDMAVDTTPTRNGRKKGKGRRRGRPTRASTRQANNAKAHKKKPSKPGEVQLKVNGIVIKEQSDQSGEWDVQLQLGASTLEVGEVGGLIWKIYADRMGGL
ncbi:hypothetical protein EST38_g3171 [Candolleomyces aberdarensis]|uniref:Bromo domain-containing protein n=1 Tax=Candolleomyces aberdarensis TaxID=2316362 RepID=A0A4Q2DR36_9AGAR|nr:hypothetical protein EST38_g3171 [Candolleomyces aberdarensis]